MKQAAGGKKADENDWKQKNGKPMMRKECGERRKWRQRQLSFKPHFLSLTVHFQKVCLHERNLEMNISKPPSFRSLLFFSSFFFNISELMQIRFRLYCFKPLRPFKQTCDEYNDDGLDALYHHLALYEIGCHITMK